MNLVADEPVASLAGVGRPRVDALDLLRGIVMVLMALDHVRDFWSPVPFFAEDLRQTTPALFWTRWVTHFCAPVFVFLAGTGAYLYGARHTRRQLAWFLLSRGLWLIVLEHTLVHLGWWFTYHNGWPGAAQTQLMGQVIWAIGASMVVLSGLVFAPTWVVGAAGLAIVFGHNALDGFSPDDLGWFGPVWGVLHEFRYQVPLCRHITWNNLYPLLPWLGVLLTGYAFGALMVRERAVWRRWSLIIGLTATLAFVGLRWSNVYGNASEWEATPPPPQTTDEQGTVVPRESSAAERSGQYPLLSFLNCQKYPPSLLFVLMTLGPALVALAAFGAAGSVWLRPLVVIGRVPLFYYLLHVPLINATSALYFQWRYGADRWVAGMFKDPPPEYEPNLWIAYAAWVGTVLVLWPVCAWYAGVKRRSRSPWLSYL